MKQTLLPNRDCQWPRGKMGPLMNQTPQPNGTWQWLDGRKLEWRKPDWDSTAGLAARSVEIRSLEGEPRHTGDKRFHLPIALRLCAPDCLSSQRGPDGENPPEKRGVRDKDVGDTRRRTKTNGPPNSGMASRGLKGSYRA